jgi:hypothetical protein
MSRSLPPMMQVLKDVAGIEMPESLLKITPDSLNGSASTEPETAISTTS